MERGQKLIRSGESYIGFTNKFGINPISGLSQNVRKPQKVDDQTDGHLNGQTSHSYAPLAEVKTSISQVVNYHSFAHGSWYMQVTL